MLALGNSGKKAKKNRLSGNPCGTGGTNMEDRWMLYSTLNTFTISPSAHNKI
jgi:hypothetical protein